jgi:16S rRNA (cytosine967-C5)-methyltransferase
MNARAVALEIVRDVFGVEHRRAQEALDYRVRHAELDARDRAFVTELAYGAIKMRRLLDWFLRPYIGDRGKPLPTTIHDVLRLGVYQLRCMGGVEEHAAVYETVKLALRHGHRGTAGLVNAVLRRFIADAPPDPQATDFKDSDDYHGVRFSMPTWIVTRLREQFGAHACEAMLEKMNAAPQHAVRIDTRRIGVDEAVSALETAGVTVKRSTLLNEVLLCAGAIPDDPDLRWIVQSEAACVPVDVLDPRAGERVVDMCSGRGRKTAQIMARSASDVPIESIELDAAKARVQQRFFERIGVASVALVVGDAVVIDGEGYADAVLLDAPCSGLGVLGRHPEARWRKRCDDVSHLAATQAALLRAAARRLKIGGRLVYSVCSPDVREGTWIIDAFLRETEAFVRRLMPLRYHAFQRGEDLLIPPGLEGRDGFYIAMLERRA